MRLGAAAVHNANEDMLIVVSGQRFGSYIRQLKGKSFISDTLQNLHPDLNNRIVYEMHFYNLLYIRPFWGLLDEKKVCKKMHAALDWRVGFVLEEGKPYTAPVWLSEFGLDVPSYHSEKRQAPDSKWMKCLREYMETRDMDFSYWVLVGEYYRRERQQDYREDWGLLDRQCSGPKLCKNMNLLQQIKELMLVRMGPGIDRLNVETGVTGEPNSKKPHQPQQSFQKVSQPEGTG
jgi:hypothetical protein